MEGEETVQLYVQDKVARITRPIKEFQKLFLKAGESKIVTFHIIEEMLGYDDNDLNFIVEEGDFIYFYGWWKQPQHTEYILLL